VGQSVTHYAFSPSALGGLGSKGCVRAVRFPWGPGARQPGKEGGEVATVFAVMRCAKLKTMGEVGALGQHNERERETRNADPERLQDNERLAGSGNWCADVQVRLDTVPLVRINAVLALEYVLTASKEFFADGDQARLAAWRDASMAWLRDTYGEKNVVAAVLHRDEITPHIQAVVVPIDEQGRLSARHFINGAEKLHAQQSSYAHAVEHLGLQRGVRGSVADHQEVQAFYSKIQEPTPAREEVLRAVDDLPAPGRLVPHPEKWAAEQREKLVAQLTPAVDAALTKARHFEGQAAKAEANNVALSERVRALEAAYKEHIAQARAADLRAVIGTLGGQPDRHDRHKFEMGNGDHISITSGGKWYNHDQQMGGGGAIDLVRHVAGYDFTDAVAYLAHESGPLVAVAAAAQHGAHAAQEIVDRGQRAPFTPPVATETRWPQVRAYLTGERALPAGLVDDLHARGTVYADARGNAVFLRQDAAGDAVGASLRGTLPGSEFKGLAVGSRRDEGHFSLTTGPPAAAYHAPQVYITESPIDALSLAALHARERGPKQTFLSTDGHGALPRREIDAALARGALVHCAFDNDQGGAKLWAQVTEAYPGAGAIVRERPPHGAKDWNDALRIQTTRPEPVEPPRAYDHDR